MMWGFGFGWIWMLLVLALVVGGAVWAASRSGTPRGDRHAGRARQALDERFARGEIDAEEYRERREELSR